MRVARCLAGLAALFAAASVSAADLSPGRWPADERAKLQQSDFFPFPPFAGAVQGGRVLVTGSQSRVAVHAGMEALAQGGTAADAAAAVALTEVATNLGSVVSYAGATQILYFDARTGKVYALDAGWGSYRQETDPASIPPDDDENLIAGVPAPAGAGVGALGRQTLVPGFMAGLEAMHARFGRLPFGDLLQPSIWYAENGVTITPVLAAYFRERQKQLWRTPEGRRFASMPDGALPKTGDLFRQPDLATTLKGVAAQGAAYMYSGDWAHAYVAAVRAEGGRVTLEDMAGYRPVWRDPLSVRYAGATVFGPGVDVAGQCPVMEALNLLPGLQADPKGAYWRDPKAFEAYVRALRYAQYARFVPQVGAFERAHGFADDCKARITPQYAAAVGPQITSLLGAPVGGPGPGHHSNAVIVVDRWGDVAALVHTINTVTWGDCGIVVGGVPIADAAAVNKAKLIHLKPGELVPSEMSPVIALRDGKPVLAVASVGSALTPETTRLVAALLGGAGDLQTVMAAPPMIFNITPPAPDQSLLSWPEAIPAGAYDPAMLKAAAAQGVSVRDETRQMTQNIRGTAVAAMIDQPSGAPRAVEDPTMFGVAESDLQLGAPIPKAIALSPQVLDRYVGAYRSGPGQVTQIVRNGDVLYSQVTGLPPAALFPVSETRFLSRTSATQRTFRLDPSGQASAMEFGSGGIDMIAPRIDEAAAAQIETRQGKPITGPAGQRASASAAVDVAGDWIGTLSPTARVAFHFRRTPGGGYEGTADSSLYQSFGVPIYDLVVGGDALSMAFPSINATYDGKWDAAANAWVGQLHQNGATMPLIMRRGVFPPAPTVAGLDGDWAGTLSGDNGGLGLHVETNAHGTFAKLDLRSQNLYGAAVSSISRKGSHVTLTIASMAASLDGEVSNDGKTIASAFTAFGATRPLILTHAAMTAAVP